MECNDEAEEAEATTGEKRDTAKATEPAARL